MMYYIYIHFKKNTDDVFYIGKGTNKGTKKRYKSKYKRNKYWNRVVNKYGFDYSIIDESNCENEIFELEKLYISLFKSWGFKLVNLTDGGEGTSGYKHTKEHKYKNSISKLGNKFCVGRKLSDETKNKISASQKGREVWNKGIPRTEQEKAKMRKAKIGKKLSDEHKIKISINNKNSKSVIQLDLNGNYINDFNSSAEASRSLGKKLYGNILECCNKKRKTAYGFKWEFKNIKQQASI